MTLADTQQQPLLERLRQTGQQPVAFTELHTGGVRKSGPRREAVFVDQSAEVISTFDVVWSR